MKHTLRLIRRFVFILMFSVILLFVLNVILFIAATYDEANTRGGWQWAEEITEELLSSDGDGLKLSQKGAEILEELDAWAILVEDGTGDVIWHSDNLPQEVPLHYSAADISWGTRGYIKDYPTTTASKGKDLLIMGHPKTRYWKQMWNTWDYNLIKNAPGTILKAAGVNLLVIVFIYMASTFGFLRSVKPVVDGIERLPKEEVHVRERGQLSGLACAINQASERLRSQEHALKKKERAQANWIAGVSHDIRTPLSMVMGYAGELEENRELPDEARKQAQVIRLQSVRMKNLINDLNLYSRLEYTMQPLKRSKVDFAAVVRLAAADFINSDLEQKYPVEWSMEEGLSACMIDGDKELLGRAVNNILTNVRVHNPDGCRIIIKMEKEKGKDGKRTDEKEKDETGKDETGKLSLVIEDNGTGADQEQLERLKNTPHYMMCDRNGSSERGERHGMGLLIVRQIAEVHGGTAEFFQSQEGGFGVKLTLTLEHIAVMIEKA